MFTLILATVSIVFIIGCAVYSVILDIHHTNVNREYRR